MVCLRPLTFLPFVTPPPSPPPHRIAAKTEEQLPFVNTHQLVRLTQNMFTAKELVEAETKARRGGV